MLPIRLSELPEAPLDVSQSGIFPVSDVPNDITYKLSLQQIPSLSANKNIKIKTSSYTITKNDYNTILYFNNVDNDTAILTIPNNNSKRIQPGYSIKIVRYNTGNVQIVPENGVTIYSTNGLFLHSQYSVATLTKIDTNSWIVEGHLFRRARFLNNLTWDNYVDGNGTITQTDDTSWNILGPTDGGGDGWSYIAANVPVNGTLSFNYYWDNTSDGLAYDFPIWDRRPSQGSPPHIFWNPSSSVGSNFINDGFASFNIFSEDVVYIGIYSTDSSVGQAILNISNLNYTRT
jgi:hypothetical protein